MSVVSFELELNNDAERMPDNRGEPHRTRGCCAKKDDGEEADVVEEEREEEGEDGAGYDGRAAAAESVAVRGKAGREESVRLGSRGAKKRGVDVLDDGSGMVETARKRANVGSPDAEEDRVADASTTEKKNSGVESAMAAEAGAGTGTVRDQDPAKGRAVRNLGGKRKRCETGHDEEEDGRKENGNSCAEVELESVSESDSLSDMSIILSFMLSVIKLVG